MGSTLLLHDSCTVDKSMYKYPTLPYWTRPKEGKSSIDRLHSAPWRKDSLSSSLDWGEKRKASYISALHNNKRGTNQYPGWYTATLLRTPFTPRRTTTGGLLLSVEVHT